MPEAAELSANPLLVVERLSKSFGAVAAVREVSFEVSRGETVAFLGPNGAGKSTTLRMIAGFLDPDEGSVTVGGHEMATARQEAQAQLGYIAEGAPLYPDLSASSYLSYVARMRGVRAGERAGAIARVAESARITDVMHRPLDALSKGYRRRVALAGTMLHDPPVLVLDEPTDGLDPNQKQAMRIWLRELAKDKAILISTHQLDEASAMCQRAIVISAGAIVADGPTGDVLGLQPEETFSRLTATSPSPVVAGVAG